MSRSIAAVALGILVATSAGCGGGGDGDQGGMHISFNPSHLSGYFPVWELGTTQLLVTGAVSPAPSGTAYVDVLDSGSLIVLASVGISGNADGSFTATLPLRGDLAPGTHTGSLTVKICRDNLCANPYQLDGGTIPYAITVTPEVTTTATADLLVDGVTQTGTGGATDGFGVRNYSVSMPTGSLLEIDTSIPIMTWSGGGVGNPTVQITSMALQKLTARLSLGIPADISETTSFEALAADGQMFDVHVTVTH